MFEKIILYWYIFYFNVMDNLRLICQISVLEENTKCISIGFGFQKMHLNMNCRGHTSHIYVLRTV